MCMEMFKNLFDKYVELKTVFKSFFLLVILFLVFFAGNLLIAICGKRESAYTALNHAEEKQKLMLQDTRVHNWSEVGKKN